jgi:molybdopterin-binding protein
MTGKRNGRRDDRHADGAGDVTSSDAADAVVGHIAAAGLPADPQLLMFVVQLVLHGGNASEAARSLGWSAQTGRKYVAKYPGLRDLAMDATTLQSKAVVRRWADSHATAIQKIHDLMNDAEDERVQLQAALAVVERVEGKVPQKVEVETDDPADIFASVVTRFVTALHLQKGMGVAAAMMYAEQHPDAVEEWGRRHGLLTAGAETP